MIESVEQIKKALTISGVSLIFEFGDILGIPGEDIAYAVGRSSPQEIAVQKFYFQTFTDDVVENNIVRGMLFQYEIFNSLFYFKVDRLAKGLTGWTEIQASLLNIEAL